MKQSIKEISPVLRQVTVDVSADRINEIIDAAVKQFTENLTLDGFKAGSVPPALVGQRFQEEIFSLAEQNMLDIAITSMTHEHGLHPVNRVVCNDCNIVRGQPCTFNLQFEIIPPIALPDKLEDLSVKVREPALEPDIFFVTLQRLLRSKGTLEDVAETRRPQDGDVMFIDIDAQYKGENVPGLSAKNVAIRLSEGRGTPEVMQVARTLLAGTHGTCLMPCPEEYPDARLRGKDITLTVFLRNLKKEILPELNDAFAATLGHNDLRSLQETIYKELLSAAIVRNQREAEENLLSSLVEPLDFDLPQSLLLIHHKAHMLQARAFFAGKGLKGPALEQKMEEIHSKGEEAAREQAKAQTFLMALAYREKIVVSEQDLTQEIQKIARKAGREADALKEELYKTGAIYELQDQILSDMALKLLYSKAQKIVVDGKGNQVQAGHARAV